MKDDIIEREALDRLHGREDEQLSELEELVRRGSPLGREYGIKVIAAEGEHGLRYEALCEAEVAGYEAAARTYFRCASSQRIPRAVTAGQCAWLERLAEGPVVDPADRYIWQRGAELPRELQEVLEAQDSWQRPASSLARDNVWAAFARRNGS